MLRYMDFLLEAGHPAHKATTALAAIRDAEAFASDWTFPRAKKALRGYNKQRPPKSRAPLAAELMAFIASGMVMAGQREMAIMVATLFFTYCRPGELRTLRVKQLLKPVRRTGALSHWTLTLAPEEESGLAVQTLTKTGVMDDAVVLDNPPWLGPMLGRLALGRRREDLLFTVDARRMVRLFKELGAAAGLPPICLYQLRHGGASEELLTGARSAESIKSRGRWRTETSLRRYAKPAQVQKLVGQLHPHLVEKVRLARLHLQGILDGTVPPPK